MVAHSEKDAQRERSAWWVVEILPSPTWPTLPLPCFAPNCWGSPGVMLLSAFCPNETVEFAAPRALLGRAPACELTVRQNIHLVPRDGCSNFRSVTPGEIGRDTSIVPSRRLYGGLVIVGDLSGLPSSRTTSRESEPTMWQPGNSLEYKVFHPSIHHLTRTGISAAAVAASAAFEASLNVSDSSACVTLSPRASCCLWQRRVRALVSSAREAKEASVRAQHPS